MNTIELLNTIRDNASEQYQERIPEATRNNIQTIQDAMLDSGNVVVANEFASMLLNMVVKQVVHDKLFKNPLKTLKQGEKPLGDTVEEIYANFLKAESYDPAGTGLLQRKLPDVKAVYHRMNRQDKYKVTISRQQLAKAFTSYERLGSFVQSIINQLFNSSELDEFILTKQLIKIALDNNAMKVVEIADPLLGETEAKEFIKTVKTVSGDMVYPSDKNNAYLTAQDVDVVPITTFSRKDEQVLIIDNATNVSVNIDVLASVFNMSVAEFNDTRKIVIDAFPDPTIRAALVDDKFFQIYDDLVYFSNFRNEEGLYDNYYLHIWQTLAYSILVNAVAFRVGSDADSDGKIETFNVTYTLKEGVKSSNKRKTAAEGSSYATTLTGMEALDGVAVTMGGTNITETAYDSNTGKVTIASVTGDIEIEVVAAPAETEENANPGE